MGLVAIHPRMPEHRDGEWRDSKWQFETDQSPAQALRVSLGDRGDQVGIASQRQGRREPTHDHRDPAFQPRHAHALINLVAVQTAPPHKDMAALNKALHRNGRFRQSMAAADDPYPAITKQRDGTQLGRGSGSR